MIIIIIVPQFYICFARNSTFCNNILKNILFISEKTLFLDLEIIIFRKPTEVIPNFHFRWLKINVIIET